MHKNDFSIFSEHQDWFGVDENLGPIAVSIRRERVPSPQEEKGILNSLSSEQVSDLVLRAELLYDSLRP